MRSASATRSSSARHSGPASTRPAPSTSSAASPAASGATRISCPLASPSAPRASSLRRNSRVRARNSPSPSGMKRPSPDLIRSRRVLMSSTRSSRTWSSPETPNQSPASRTETFRLPSETTAATFMLWPLGHSTVTASPISPSCTRNSRASSASGSRHFSSAACSPSARAGHRSRRSRSPSRSSSRSRCACTRRPSWEPKRLAPPRPGRHGTLPGPRGRTTASTSRPSCAG